MSTYSANEIRTFLHSVLKFWKNCISVKLQFRHLCQEGAPLIIIPQSLIALFADFWNTVLSIQYIPFWVSNMSHILSQYKHLILKTPLALWLLGI